MLRHFMSGESHGPCSTVIIDGVPAGFPADLSNGTKLWEYYSATGSSDDRQI